MNDPEVLYITYNMNYFIEKAKQECYRLKYKEDDIDCAYDNLNQIFDTIIRCVRDNQEHYSDILMRGVCALLDKYPTIIEINIIAGNYTNMAFTATRRENDKYNFKLSVTKLGSDTTGVIKLKE